MNKRIGTYALISMLMVTLFAAFALAPTAQVTVGACTFTNITVPSGTTLPAIICTLCQIYSTVVFVILFVALALLALGGILYAAAHLLPGQQRGGLQGYGFGMIIGGVVGIILVILDPFIITTVISSSAFNPFTYITFNAGIAHTVVNMCAGSGLL